MPQDQTAYLNAIAALTTATNLLTTATSQVGTALANSNALLITANGTIDTLEKELATPIDTSQLTSLTASVTSAANALLAQTQVATSITLTQDAPTVPNDGTATFTPSVLDQNQLALVNQPTVTWALQDGAAGTITTSGVYTAPASGSGSDTVTATVGTLTASASVGY